MRRLALSLIVGILSFSATGVTRLIVGEPCAPFTLAAEDDGDCPPTCISCGCCAQAVEPAALIVAVSIEIVTPLFNPVPPAFTDSEPRDILHVPRLRAA